MELFFKPEACHRVAVFGRMKRVFWQIIISTLKFMDFFSFTRGQWIVNISVNHPGTVIKHIKEETLGNICAIVSANFIGFCFSLF